MIRTGIGERMKAREQRVFLVTVLVSKPAVIVVLYHDCVRGITSIGAIRRYIKILFRPPFRPFSDQTLSSPSD